MIRLLSVLGILSVLLLGNNFPELKMKDYKVNHKYKEPTLLDSHNNLRRDIEFLSDRYGEGDKKIYILSSESCKYCKALIRTIKDEVRTEYTYYVLELRQIDVENRDEQREIQRIFSELRVIGYPTIYTSAFKQKNIRDIVEYSTFKINLY